MFFSLVSDEESNRGAICGTNWVFGRRNKGSWSHRSVSVIYINFLFILLLSICVELSGIHVFTCYNNCSYCLCFCLKGTQPVVILLQAKAKQICLLLHIRLKAFFTFYHCCYSSPYTHWSCLVMVYKLLWPL